MKKVEKRDIMERMKEELTHICPESVAWKALALRPTERKVLVRLIQAKSRTFYDLATPPKKRVSEEPAVASGKAVLKALQSLKSKKLISAEQEEVGRHRIFYRLTEAGLLTALGLDEVWRDPKTIERAAQMHKEKSPHIFGKLDFYKEVKLDLIMLTALKKHAGLIILEKLRRPHFKDEELFDETCKEAYDHINEILPKGWVKNLKTYPEPEVSPIDPHRELTENVLFLSSLQTLKRNRAPIIMSILHDLIIDDEISQYVTDYLEREVKEAANNYTRLKWWEAFTRGIIKSRVRDREDSKVKH